MSKLPIKNLLATNVEITNDLKFNDASGNAISFDDRVGISVVGQPGLQGKSAYQVAMGISGATQLTETEWLATLVGPPGADGDAGSGGGAISIAPSGWNTFDFLANPSTGTLPAAPTNPESGQIYIHTDESTSVVRIYLWKPQIPAEGFVPATPGAWYHLASGSDSFGGLMNLRKVAIPS